MQVEVFTHSVSLPVKKGGKQKRVGKLFLTLANSNLRCVFVTTSRKKTPPFRSCLLMRRKFSKTKAPHLLDIPFRKMGKEMQGLCAQPDIWRWRYASLNSALLPLVLRCAKTDVAHKMASRHKAMHV